jgi:hypothetical protein
MFLTAPGPSMVLNGAEIGINQIAVGYAGASYTSRLLGPTQWGGVTLTPEDMDAVSAPKADCCTKRLSGMTAFTPLPAALARLRSLHSYMESMQSCGVHYDVNATASSSFAGRKPG